MENKMFEIKWEYAFTDTYVKILYIDTIYKSSTRGSNKLK